MLCALHVHFLFKFTPYEERIIISCLRDKKIVVPRDKVTCPKLHSFVRGASERSKIEARSVRSLAVDHSTVLCLILLNCWPRLGFPHISLLPSLDTVSSARKQFELEVWLIVPGMLGMSPSRALTSSQSPESCGGKE